MQDTTKVKVNPMGYNAFLVDRIVHRKPWFITPYSNQSDLKFESFMADVREFSCSRAPEDAVDLDYITEELKIRAQKELFEDDTTRIESLKSLRALLKEEKDLRYQDDEIFLLAFLRARKFDVKRAFSLITRFYNCMGKYGHLYYVGFDYFHKMLEENTYYVLPHRDNQGSAISYIRCSSWNPENIMAEEHVVCGSLGVLEALRSPATQIAGFTAIFNLKGFSLKQLMKLTPRVWWFVMEILQNTIPVRIRGLHLVYENALVSHALIIIKLFLSKKLKERIHIHGNDMKSLHQFFQPSVLPEELGGELPPFDNSEWRQRMEKSSDYFNHVFSFGYEQYLRKDWKSAMPNKNK